MTSKVLKILLRPYLAVHLDVLDVRLLVRLVSLVRRQWWRRNICLVLDDSRLDIRSDINHSDSSPLSVTTLSPSSANINLLTECPDCDPATISALIPKFPL